MWKMRAKMIKNEGLSNLRIYKHILFYFDIELYEIEYEFFSFQLLYSKVAQSYERVEVLPFFLSQFLTSVYCC